VEVQAILISEDMCVGSTFVITAGNVGIGDTIIFGKLVSGFITLARDDRMTVDIRTAVIECQPDMHGPKTSGRPWKVCNVLTSAEAVVM
jgi:hypothetical protein